MCARPILVGMVSYALAVTVGAMASLSSQQAALVPWRVLEPGAQPANARLVLYWLPSSADELRRSELVVSGSLTSYAGRCVAMRVVRAEDDEAVSRLAARHQLPLVVLMEGQTEVGRVDSDGGVLRVAAVESIVRAALEAREAAADAALDEARRRVARGENQEAATIYRDIAAQRCMFPRQARTAARALRRLGAAE